MSLGFNESDADDLPGIEVGERIGGGAFGDVYEAIELDAGLRRVAIKFLHPDLAAGESLARFEDESRLLALLTHAHVARLFRAGRSSSGRPYYLMELVDGAHLQTWARSASKEDRLSILIQIASALTAAHHAGIVHRDLKPGNILVEALPQGPHARVIDFGIARALEGPASVGREATLRSQRLGTPLYMSPEQIAGDPLVDMRSDIFAFGLLIYEMALGRPALDGVIDSDASWDAQLTALRSHVFPPLEDPELGWIALKCCALDPEERYQSAAELHADLIALRDGGTVSAGTHYWVYRTKKLILQHRVALVLATCVLLAALSVGVAGWWTSVKERQALVAIQKAQALAKIADSDSSLLASFRAMDRGLFAEARDHLDRALALNPENEEADYASRFLKNTVTFAKEVAVLPLDVPVENVQPHADGSFHLSLAGAGTLRIGPDASMAATDQPLVPLQESALDQLQVEISKSGVATFTDTSTGAPAMAPLVFGSGRERAFYHPGSKRLLVLAPNDRAILWDVSGMSRAHEALHFDVPATWLAFERKTSDLWIIDENRQLREWSVSGKRSSIPIKLGAMDGPLGLWNIGEGHVRGLASGSTGFFFFSQLALWHLSNDAVLTTLATARLSDTALLGGSSANDARKIGFQPAGKPITGIDNHQGTPTLVAIDAHATLGASVNLNNQLQIINLDVPTVSHTIALEVPVSSMTILDSGREIILAHTDGTVSVFDAKDSKFLYSHLPLLGKPEEVTGVEVRAVPGKPEFLCRADNDLALRIFAAEDLTECAPALRHEEGVYWFCTDANFLFSIDQNENSNGTLRVWSLRTYREVVPGLSHPSPLIWATILDQGERIATTDEQGTVRRWTVARD